MYIIYQLTIFITNLLNFMKIFLRLKIKNIYLIEYTYMEVEASLINSILLKEFKNYFIYTCILNIK
jgi:hypothetical protein